MANEFFVLHHDDIKVLEVVEGRMPTLNRIKEIIIDFDEDSKKLAGKFIENDMEIFNQGSFHLKSITFRNGKGKASHVYLGDKK